MNGRAARLRAQLEGLGRVRIELRDIHAAWAAAAPEMAGRYESRHALAEDLGVLAASGVVLLPSAKSWERSVVPALPSFVRVPSARKPPRTAVWRERTWHPDLGWAASLSACPPRHLAALEALDGWLAAVDGHELTPVPLRFRSAEIFGDEKLLEELAGSSLFAPGRLSLERLGVVRRPPPLVLVRVGPGPDVLVVENSDPFWVCCDLLAAMAGPVGRIGFGAGNAFVASVAALWAEPEPVGRVFYWGDFDPKGADIAVDAAALAAATGTVTLEPAGPLWAAMASWTPTSGGAHTWSERAAGWFGHELWGRLKPVRVAAGRVAQEQLTPAVIAAALADLPRSRATAR